MNFFIMLTVILSHILGALYIQQQKYNKLVTACFWGAYAVFAAGIMLFQANIIYGFFALLFVQAAIFFITSKGSIGEKIFLFLTYANSFCIYLGASLILSSFFKEHAYLPIYTTAILILTHMFLYKVIVPSYKRSKIFFHGGWWKINVVLIFFIVQFVNQYAFADAHVDRIDFVISFSIFSIIYYSTLILIFDMIRATALMHRKEIENVELEKIAYLDVLTNIQSRVAYMKFTKDQVLRHRHNMSSSSFVLAMMDVDGFKKINDTRGHAAGDEILKSVGAVINELFECHSFRIGGDEFVLLFENKQISDVEDKIINMNENLYNSYGITMSYGCSEVNFDDKKPFETAYKKADALMYSCKEKRSCTVDLA